MRTSICCAVALVLAAPLRAAEPVGYDAWRTMEWPTAPQTLSVLDKAVPQFAGTRGVTVGGVEFRLEPETVTARQGQQIGFRCVLINRNTTPVTIPMRAVARYNTADGEANELTATGTITIPPDLSNVVLLFYVPAGCGHVNGTFGVGDYPGEEVPEGERWGADPATGELYLVVQRDRLLAGKVLSMKSTVQVGAQNTLPDGTVIEAPPAPPGG